MNRSNNIFNKNEIENKIKDFKEGQDYSVSPTDEPNIKTYNFYNDKLRSMFRGDKVPVRITREAYDGKDYTYRGHFEEGKDYRYSTQCWDYSKGRNDYRETQSFYYPKPVEEWVENCLRRRDFERGISIHSEGGKIGENGLEKHWEVKEHFYRKVEDSEVEMRRGKLKEFQEKKHFWEMRLIEERDNPKSCCEKHLRSWINNPNRQEVIENIKKSINELETKIQYEKDWLAKNSNSYEKSDLHKENHELRQQLAKVQKQLAEVLEELKKLRSNINDKGGEKLNQQIAYNEGLIKNSENVSVAEVQEQVQKSQALMNELNVVTSTNKDNKGNGSLPYVIGGSVILALVGIIGYFLVKKIKRK